MLKRGFTLIELLVSVAIFSVVVMIALGALLAMSEADRKAQALKTVVNNLNFSLESMSRTIRTSVNYQCNITGQDCASGGASIRVLDPAGRTVDYWFNNAQANLCNQSPAAVGCILRSINGSSWAPLTAPEVVISSAKFFVLGSARYSTGDRTQPRVVMLMSGYVQFTETQTTPFNIQTTVTQRVYDQ